MFFIAKRLIKTRTDHFCLRFTNVVYFQVFALTSLVLTDVRAHLDTLDGTATSILMNASHHLAAMVSETFYGSAKLGNIVGETFSFQVR